MGSGRRAAIKSPEIMTKINDAAAQIWRAYETHETCQPVRTYAEAGDAAFGYDVQEVNTKRWLDEGRRLVGRKIGLTSHAVQAQLGVDQPDYGMLFADMSYCDGEIIPADRFLQPRIEAEVGFVINADLTGEDLTITELIGAVEYAVAALEIVDSRIAGWDIRLADTIADNASSGAFVTGTRPVALCDLDLPGLGMTMTCDGDPVSSGKGSACLGNPLNAALWLARVMIKSGRPLKAGDLILSGALGPMVDVKPGQSFTAQIEGLGSVTAQFDGGAS